VVSPDNESRLEINGHIHRTMQNTGQVSSDEHGVHLLFARQDLTGADRRHAQNYESGDAIRYSKGSKPLRVEAGEYARVAHVDAKEDYRHSKQRRGTQL
jgi:hypothetical protein